MVGIQPRLRVSTHRPIPWHEVSKIADPVFIVGGTNLLNSDQPFRRWWRLGPRDIRRINHSAVLFGVGWWQYQRDPNLYTSWAYRTSLTSQIENSVRDGYTRNKLHNLGIPATNTGCPTTWALTERPEHRESRGKRVITTITDYAKNPQQDSELLDLLGELYDEVAIWPQGQEDEVYIRSLGSGASTLGRDLETFDREVSDPETDYVGTRLHAGIRALQFGTRSTILEVDNRAREMGSDLGLPVVRRELDSHARTFIAADRQVTLTLPRREIDAWKESLRAWVGLK